MVATGLKLYLAPGGWFEGPTHACTDCGSVTPRRLAAHRTVGDHGKTRPRRHLQDQRRRVAALESDGDRELPHRRLRPAPHRLAQHQGSRRLGAEDDEAV